jgi:hypothetical protein
LPVPEFLNPPYSSVEYFAGNERFPLRQRFAESALVKALNKSAVQLVVTGI